MFSIYTNGKKSFVILPPSMYWFRECHIPTRNPAKAKNIARHILSDRPKAFEEIYIRRQKDGMYHVYAYDLEHIQKTLQDTKVEEYKLFFADQLDLMSCGGCVRVDRTHVFTQLAGRVLVLQEQKECHVNLEEVYEKLLAKVKPAYSFAKTKRANTKVLVIGIVLFLFFVLFDGLQAFGELHALTTEHQKLANSRSFYEVRSLIKGYDKLQKHKENMLSKLVTLSEKDSLKLLKYKNGVLKVEKE